MHNIPSTSANARASSPPQHQPSRRAIPIVSVSNAAGQERVLVNNNDPNFLADSDMEFFDAMNRLDLYFSGFNSGLNDFRKFKEAVIAMSRQIRKNKSDISIPAGKLIRFKTLMNRINNRQEFKELDTLNLLCNKYLFK